MEYIEQLLNKHDQPLLDAERADKAIADLRSIIAAQASVIAELQEVIRIAATKERP